MEPLKAILALNELHPAGRRSTHIADLCARVEVLERENKELRDAIENTLEASQEARGEAILPTDDALLAFLRERPSTLRKVCEHFGVPYCYSSEHPRSDGAIDGYTDAARAIGNQLQRLRRGRMIRCGKGMRWTATVKEITHVG